MFPLKSNTDADSKVYVDDVFSTYPYTGNGSTQNIVNGIDLAGKGGLVWIKCRSNALYSALTDTARGANEYLMGEHTAGNSGFGLVTGFNSNGFGVTAIPGNGVNGNYQTHVSWTFRNADKFFKVAQVTKSAGSNATLDLSNLGTVGMVRVKRTDSSGSWYVWHRSLPAGQLLIGESTAAATTLGHITVTGTTLTLVNGVIADGTYHVEAYAHDTSADGMIQCGSFTGAASDVAVTLGFEPQWLMVKNATNASSWLMMDSMRGMPFGNGKTLAANSSAAENGVFGADNILNPTATGFIAKSGKTASNENGSTHIYLAIRRPNRPPKTGVEVYNAVARNGTGAAATITGVGFAPDLALIQGRTTGHGANLYSTFFDRLRGKLNFLSAQTTSAENTSTTDTLLSFDQAGVSLGADSGWLIVNGNAETYINHFFKRAVGVFDEVCYTGTGSATTIPHNLGVVPELMIVKRRDNTGDWIVYLASLGNVSALYLHTTLGTQSTTTAWNSTSPTSSVFTLGANSQINANGSSGVAYLFATCPGISKVGSFTGNGTSQNIDCGFTTGARFFLVKSTSTAGSWWMYDSTRGIISAADPALQLNSTAAEVTADAVDPDNSGIIVNQEATCSINANGVSYIYLAFS